MKRQMREPSEKLHNILSFLSGALVVVLALVIVAGVRAQAKNAAGDQEKEETQAYVAEVVTQEETTESTESEKWQEGVVTYNGQEYLYNSDITSYLMMGIDVDSVVEQATDFTQGGQADALFLLVVDSGKEQISVVSINRNTMTDISLCDENGSDMGTISAQICLQHAFGDGMRTSCSATVDAVSALFGDIPISGYLSMNMGGIPQMNDAIGGVTLTVLQNVSFPDAGVDLKKGTKVTLSGTEAYYYLHGRDTKKYDSATKRLRREEQYIVAYMAKLKELAASDASAAAAAYDAVSDYLVSSMDFSGLIEELSDYGFSEEQIYTVPGETTMGEPVDGKSYEEYYVDEAALQEMIMEIFYTPVEE